MGVINNLDPDQDWQNVSPDLGPNCLQSLSEDDTSLQGVNYERWYLWYKDNA